MRLNGGAIPRPRRLASNGKRQSHDGAIRLSRSSRPPTTRSDRPPAHARPVRNAGLPRALGRSDAAYLARDVGLHGPRSGRAGGTLDVGRIPGAAARDRDDRHPLRHEVVRVDTVWEGVSVDTLLAEAFARGVESAPYVLAVSDGGYTTNLPLADVTRGKAWR